MDQRTEVDIKAYLLQRRELVDKALEAYLPGDESGGIILKAMRYSLFAGGKRLRPILCMAGAEASGGDPASVMFCACAMEMIHTYSLIHDDLPAMDDDDFRRGVPTNHKVFGDGMAVLAGDGLLTQAMVLLSDKESAASLEPGRVIRASNIVMRAAGYLGMVGGQASDLEGEDMEPDLAMVDFIHSRKTGALITAAIQSGAVLAGADAQREAPVGALWPPYWFGLSDSRRPAGSGRRCRGPGQGHRGRRGPGQDDLSGGAGSGPGPPDR